MHFTKEQALKVGNQLNINFNVIPFKEWLTALKIESEHSKNDLTDVAHGSLIKTAKIALAHLMEYPDYYKRLVKMEKKAEKYWSNKEKPYLFNV